MRTPSWWLLVLVAGGCKGEPFRPDAALDAPEDAFEAPWWTPAPGEAADWDLQLVDPVDVTAPRAVYDLDLWQITPARTITYADQSTIAVPAGRHVGAIDTIHARSPKPIIICHFNIGSVDLVNDPDRTKFPGYEAAPPNDPTPPKAGSAIGWSTNLPATTERWLDIRPATRDAWREVLDQRLQLAKDIGCDAVDADRGIPDQGSSGFGTLLAADYAGFLKGVAASSHTRTLSAGTRLQPILVDELDGDFDWLLLERCGENLDCDAGRPFINAQKAVLAVDYLMDANGGTTLLNACAQWSLGMIRDGLFKKDPPAGNFRMVCP